jgi:FHA domain
MATCPKGHTSVATDYCDECGAAISPPTPAAAPASTVDPAPDPTVTGEPCPECQTPRDGRFCEVCGHDFLASPSAASSSPSPPPTPTPSGTSSTVEPVVAPPSPSTGTGTAAWRVVATADRGYYDRMQAQAEPDAEPVPFPPFCPERRFDLSGQQVLVGRRSRSRGIEPGVDLTGPPEDAGVSHSHALFVAIPDGWSVVDLDSANGTYINDASEQIAANEPVPLKAGDRVHVGAWTTLTLTPA